MYKFDSQTDNNKSYQMEKFSICLIKHSWLFAEPVTPSNE